MEISERINDRYDKMEKQTGLLILFCYNKTADIN